MDRGELMGEELKRDYRPTRGDSHIHSEGEV